MKAIVFGSSGFIGSHVVEQLQRAGHQVTAAVREKSNTIFLKSIGANIEKIDFENVESIGMAIKGHEVVYNCMADAQFDMKKEWQDQDEIKMAKVLIEAAARFGASRFIQLSSIVVYDFRTNEPIDELYEPQPEFPMQNLKLEKDKMIQEAGQKLGISTIVLRPASTIGLRDRKSFFARMVTAHISDQYPMLGSGQTKVSLIDTRDIGRAMVFLGTFPKPEDDNGLYLIKGFDTTWCQLKKEIDMAIGRIAAIAELPSNDSSFKGRNLSVNRLWNDAKLKNLGFQTIYSLKDAVETSVRDILQIDNQEVF